MKIEITGTPKEIAVLVLAVQERQSQERSSSTRSFANLQETLPLFPTRHRTMSLCSNVTELNCNATWVQRSAISFI